MYTSMFVRSHIGKMAQRQLTTIKNAGLYDACNTISLGVLGTGDISSFKERYPKINVLFQDPNTALYERPTLLSLHKTSISNPENSIVLYLHTKGISRVSPFVQDWSVLMEYFLIDRWKDCIQELQSHDVCGVNWQLGPQPHFRQLLVGLFSLFIDFAALHRPGLSRSGDVAMPKQAYIKVHALFKCRPLFFTLPKI